MPKKSLVDVLKQTAGIDQDRKIARLQAENRSLRSKYQQAIADLELAEQRAEFVQTLDKTINPKTLKRLKQVPGGDSTAIIVLSDWHVEERVDSHSVNGLNKFNLSVAEKRIAALFQKAMLLLTWARTFADIRELVVAILGDVINGYIHEEFVESNYLSPTEACLFIQDQICTGLDFLVKEADVTRITVPTCHGNHGRSTQQRRISTAYKNSYEWLTYNTMARYYANEPKVAWQIGKGYHNWLTIQKHNVRFHHGDAFRYAGGVGGITVPVNKKIAQWNKSRRADLDIFGHFHSFTDHWTWVCCGALVGYNAYAIEIGAAYQPPSQTFIVVSKKYGKVLTMPIFLGDQ